MWLTGFLIENVRNFCEASWQKKSLKFIIISSIEEDQRSAKMRKLVIIIHPDMENSVVNRMWKNALINEQIDVVDLNELYPDRNIDVAREQERLMSYDTIVFQFPLYWYSSPPLLKQYQDEVFLFNFAYGPEGTKLRDKKFAIATTVGSLEEDYSEEGSNRFTLDTLLSPFVATFNYIGAQYKGHFEQYGKVNHATKNELIEGSKRYIEFVKAL